MQHDAYTHIVVRQHGVNAARRAQSAPLGAVTDIEEAAAGADLCCGRRDASNARPPGETTTRGHRYGAVAYSGAGKKPVATAASVTVVEPMMSTCVRLHGGCLRRSSKHTEQWMSDHSPAANIMGAKTQN